MPEHCGNPLLRDWVKEWMDKSQSLQSKAYFTYKKAYDSLCKCPVTFSHPSEAICLAGIGEGMVKRLEENMKKYCKENNLPMPSRTVNSKAKRKRDALDEVNNTESANGRSPSATQVKSRRTKPYVPAFRTGGYAILLALLNMYENNQLNGTRDQICNLAQPYCDSSFTLADAGKSYTAWNSMKTLCDKGYVWKNGKPAKYQLTDTGIELAKKLKQVNDGQTEAPSLSLLPTSSGAAFAAAAMEYENSSTNSNVDMSLYVLDPSKHQTTLTPDQTFITTSTTRSNDTQEETSDNESVIANIGISIPNLYDSTSSANQYERKRQKNKSTTKTTTSDLLDSLLKEKERNGGNDLNTSDLNLYVLNPNEHQSFSINGQTTSNYNNDGKSTALSLNNTFTIPKKCASNKVSASFSITNSNALSSAKRVTDTFDNNDPDDLNINFSSSSSFSSRLTGNKISASMEDENEKTTMTSSSIPSVTNSNKPDKRRYNIDEYEINLTPSSFPIYKSNHSSNKEDNIVDLLSSPELSPLLQPTQTSASTQTATERDNAFIFEDDFDSDKDFFPLSQSRVKQIVNETFHFTYLDATNEPVRHVAKAAVCVDEANHSLAYLIKFYTNQAHHPKAQHVIQQRIDGEFTTGYLREGAIDSVCPGLPASPILPLHREEEDGFWPEPVTTANEDPLFSDSQSSIRSNQSQLFFSSQQQQLERDLTSQAMFPLSQIGAQDSTQSSAINYAELIARETCAVMQPNEYDILLVLDSREIQMRGNRDYFQEHLLAKGVQCITRSMNIGDVIWVAKKKGSSNQSDELVLDYIVERKRLDDLVSSIKDGRFTEQKTRLKRSGLEKIIYVIEEYNRDEAERFGMQAIQTALSSMQIVDGIFLKRTQNIDETIDYLVSTTQLIKQIYNETTLYSIQDHIVTRQNYLNLKDAYRNKQANEEGKVAYLVNYSLFSQLNAKNGPISLHEVYLRMLMTIRGINAERALSLMKVYPTPRSLLLAFKGKTPDEAKNLAKVATQGQISRRRWGKEASDKLYQVWGALEYPNMEHNNDNDFDR